MNWFFLALAVLAETAGALFMKSAEGIQNKKSLLLMYLFFTVSVTLLSFATRKMEVGVGYATWSGLGISLITIGGIIFFKENFSLMKMICIGLIVAGITGLHLLESK